MLQKMVINKIVELLSKQFKLYDIMKYVKEPNDADERIDKLETDLVASNKRIKILETLIKCSKCNDTPEQKIALENHKIK
tara:strand:- start:173 stop:412 length:240 start_codon:yes stop_codon:yes gene_type:complete